MEPPVFRAVRALAVVVGAVLVSSAEVVGALQYGGIVDQLAGLQVDACVDFAADCGADPTGAVDADAAIQRCQVLAHGGLVSSSSSESPGVGAGCVTVPAGNYRILRGVFNVSNTHWRISNEATFRPSFAYTQNGVCLFGIGQAGAHHGVVPKVQRVSNISVSGVAPGAFTIDVSKARFEPWKTVPMGVQGLASNIHVANVVIRSADPATDPAAKFELVQPCIGISGLHDAAGNAYSPERVYVGNVTGTGAVFGYGVVQVQTGRNLTFENIDGTGGIPLRLETGGNETGGFVDAVYGRNITCRDGHAAFVAWPHSQVNGAFRVEDVRSYDCSVTVDAGAGYSEYGRLPGYWSNDSSISNVVGYYSSPVNPPGHAQVNRSLSNATACWVCSEGTQERPMNWKAIITNVSSVGFPSPSDRSACKALPDIKHLGCPFS